MLPRHKFRQGTQLPSDYNTLTSVPFSRRGTVTEKPTLVADYNQYMLGVDKLDQLMAYYSFLHKSVKWWQRIYLWLLEVMVIDAYIIYKELARRRGGHSPCFLAQAD